MTRIAPAPYTPDVAIHPGATILEMLADKGMTQAELAERMDRPSNKVNELLHGKSSITAATAIALERVLGLPAAFWMELEKNYQLTRARLESEKELLAQARELKKFPLKQMVAFGWVRKRATAAEQVQELLSFFGVAAFSQLDKKSVLGPAFRRSTGKDANPYALAAWLRRGELEAEAVKTGEFDATGLRADLPRLRTLTALPPSEFLPQLVKTCAGRGVAAVFVPHLPNTYVCGAAYWSGEKAVAQLSLRFGTNDHFWFTFFHELAHLLLHGKKETFVDEARSDASKEEDEANQFASRALIPDAEYHRLQALDYRRAATVQEFAREIGLAPGIVVGRLQHDKRIPFTNLNGLKEKFVWEPES